MKKLTVENKSGVETVTLPEYIDLDEMTEFTNYIEGIISNPPRSVIIFNFKNLKSNPNQLYKLFAFFGREARKKNIRYASLDVLPEFEEKATREGLAGSFNFKNSLEEAFKFFGMDPSSLKAKENSIALDVNLVNPFIEATLSTLEVQALTKCTQGKPYLVAVDDKIGKLSIAIAGVISVATEKFQGSIAIAFPEKVFLKIYENMLGVKYDTINSEIEDAAGEVINIIYGTAKTILNTKFGYDLKPTIPTILSGEKIRLRQKTQGKVIVLPFMTDSGEFHIEVAILDTVSTGRSAA